MLPEIYRLLGDMIHDQASYRLIWSYETLVGLGIAWDTPRGLLGSCLVHGFVCRDLSGVVRIRFTRRLAARDKPLEHSAELNVFLSHLTAISALRDVLLHIIRL